MTGEGALVPRTAPYGSAPTPRERETVAARAAAYVLIKSRRNQRRPPARIEVEGIRSCRAN